MANVLNRITKRYLDSAHTPDYPAAEWIHNPNISGVIGFASKYWAISGDAVTLMPQAERDAVDAAEVTAQTAEIRAAAKTAYDLAYDELHKALKAVALATQDEMNLHALKINAILDAVDNASTFAAMKTAIAAVVDYPARTPTQLKTAVNNKVDTL